MRLLYREAESHGTFVNLDMEEYRDLELTVTAFKRVLAEAEFSSVAAGIVLQAYLPDPTPPSPTSSSGLRRVSHAPVAQSRSDW